MKFCVIFSILDFSSNLLEMLTIILTSISPIKKATMKGVRIIATLHGENFSDVDEYKNLFHKFIFLSDTFGVGTVEGVYDFKEKKCC